MPILAPCSIILSKESLARALVKFVVSVGCSGVFASDALWGLFMWTSFRWCGMALKGEGPPGRSFGGRGEPAGAGAAWRCNLKSSFN